MNFLLCEFCVLCFSSRIKDVVNYSLGYVPTHSSRISLAENPNSCESCNKKEVIILLSKKCSFFSYIYFEITVFIFLPLLTKIRGSCSTIINLLSTRFSSCTLGLGTPFRLALEKIHHRLIALERVSSCTIYHSLHHDEDHSN